MDPVDTTSVEQAERQLRRRLRQLGSALVAVSGGVDSSVVAALAAAEFGPRAVAFTGVSPSVPDSDVEAVSALCRRLGIEHVVAATAELADPRYVANDTERCYFCKHELLARATRVAAERGLAAVVDGTTADDLHDHRPGRRAAAEHGVVSPLVEAGAGKPVVRALARRLGLANAERPASPCLSSRIAYGVRITPERLERVARAEAVLRGLGFSDLRVRLHGPIARVEVPRAELQRAVENADAITRGLVEAGFVYVTLDLVGLRSGSLLEVVGQMRGDGA